MLIKRRLASWHRGDPLQMSGSLAPFKLKLLVKALLLHPRFPIYKRSGGLNTRTGFPMSTL